MAAETEAEKPEDAATEAKGMADKFVQTLGLLDLIIGGLALYWVRLWFGYSMTRLLESTGYPWLDIALLACGAAFVGKIISMAGELVAAFTDSLRKPEKSHLKRLLDAVTLYHGQIKDTSNIQSADEIDLARTYLVNANPKLRPDLDRIHDAITLAYSLTLVSALFAVYFFSRRGEPNSDGTPTTLGIVMSVLAVGFLVFGWLNQSDYLDTLTDNLNIAAAKLKVEQEHAGKATAPQVIDVNLSSAQRFAVDVFSQPIAVEVKQKETS
jgi:hypothetical protein